MELFDFINNNTSIDNNESYDDNMGGGLKNNLGFK